MPRFVAEPLPAGCPWSGWTPPNVDWCEAQRCAWVVNPSDTWSNLGYVLLGVWMIAVARRDGSSGGSPMLSLFGPASIVVGLLSFVYHASYTYFLQFFDFVGMFVFCFAVITANALRLGWTTPARRLRFYAAGVILSSLLVPVVAETPVPIQALVALLILVIVGQEAALARRVRVSARPPYALFFAALGLIGLAATLSLADVTRTLCDPESWLQGHALWHLLSALSLVTLFHFYRHLPPGPVRPSAAR